MEDKNIQYEVALAALLHDIGKFKQRAYGGIEDNLRDEVRRMEGSILPPRYGDYTHRHALWTYDFFVSDLKRIIDKPEASSFISNLKYEKIGRWASRHHNPSAADKYEKVIEKADKCSAAIDRSKDQKKHQKGDYLIDPLYSIFSSITLGNQNNDDHYSYELKELGKGKDCFPNRENIELSPKKYRNLYDSFLSKLEDSIININNWETLIRKIKELLFEYTWCIPSATNTYRCDISLYDHSITTLAIAIALINNNEGEEDVRICAFGPSGIQKFIFQSKYASFKGAAKIFRGRSFIVSILPTVFEKLVCDELGIIPFVDLMDAGGNITMILPSSNGEEIVNKLKKIEKRIEKFLLEKYHSTLSIVLDYSIVTRVEEFSRGRFMDLYKEIGKKLSEKKNKKFLSALEDYSAFIDNDVQSSKVCEACGKHGADGEEFCSLCKGQERIGGDIPNKFFLRISSSDMRGYEILPNYYLSFTDDENLGDIESQYWNLEKGEISSYPKWRLNNYTPSEMDFKDISKKAVGADGYGKPFLSYIKIDVDSLGRIIQSGIRKEEYSVSRFATLSRSLHHFFNMYVYDKLKQEYPYTYTVLSGGDDLFVIMPWNKALKFIDELKNDFSSFVAHNKELHFSCGVVVAKDTEPFALVNERANIALDEEAKEMDGKNAISYFGVTFKLDELDKFISDYKCLKERIQREEDTEKKPYSMSFIYRLYQHLETILSEETEANKPFRYSAYSKIYYDIARNIVAPVGRDDEYNEAIKFIIDRIGENDPNKLKLFRLMLIQAMYESRKTNIEEN